MIRRALLPLLALLAFAAPASAAYAKVQSCGSTYSFILNDSTESCTLSSVTANNLIIITLRLSEDEATTVNTPTGFTLARSFIHSDAGINARFFVWFKVAAGAETTQTVTTGANIAHNAQIQAMEFSGNATASVFDVFAENLATGGTTTHATGALSGTTATADNLSIGGCVEISARTWTLDAAFTTTDASMDTFQGLTGYRILSSTTSTGMTNTSSGATDGVCGLVTFKGASGGGGSVSKLPLLGVGP
jgi:hypothetical protein